MTRRPLLRALTVALASIALVAPVASGPAEAAPAFPDRIELPDGFQPEGITIGRRPVAYLGSRVDGDIYAANLRTGRGRIISQGPGTASIGLKVDRHERRLFVAGGPAGTGRVVNLRTGRFRSYQFTRVSNTFVNDVVLTRSAAWFTDSRQAQLYRLPLGRKGRPIGRVRTLPLRGDWVQVSTPPTTNNANGIAQTPDRRALLVVQSSTGYLFRVNPRTGVARRVNLGPTLLTAGDGLLVRGRTLYAVQNRLNRVAVVQLNRAGTRGRLVDTLTDPDFDVPTTVAAFGRSLYLPNARFTTPPTPTTDYWVTRIDR